MILFFFFKFIVVFYIFFVICDFYYGGGDGIWFDCEFGYIVFGVFLLDFSFYLFC